MFSSKLIGIYLVKSLFQPKVKFFLVHGVGVGHTYTPGYASGVTHYDTYGISPSYGQTNLRTFAHTHATPIYNTVSYHGHAHHGHGHGLYGHGHGYGGSYTYPAGYISHQHSGFGYDTQVQHPTLVHTRHSTSYETPVHGYAHGHGIY